MSRKVALLFSLALLLATCASAAEPIVLATGDWSEPAVDNRAFALRGRLLLIEKPRGDGRRHVAVHIELQDASEH